VLPDGVIQHNFPQKWCHFTCLCAWASEGSFPYNKNFPHKWCHFTCLCAWASEGSFPGGY